MTPEILGQIRNKIFLRTNSATTAEWAEKHFGRTEWLVESVTNSSTTSRQGGSSSTSVAHTRRRESAILGSTLMGIAPPGPSNPIRGIYDLPLIGSFAVSAHLQGILDGLPKADPTIPNTQEFPPECQRLAEWTEADRQRLGLPVDLLLAPHPTYAALLSRIENLKLD